MGQKVHPKKFRLNLNHEWDSRWFAKTNNEFSKLVKEDFEIRKKLKSLLKYALLNKIFIERSGNRIRIKIYTGRPGLVIGRKGQEIEKIKNAIQLISKDKIFLEINEVKKSDTVASIVAQNVAIQLEKRISFRRAMKRAIQSAVNLGVEGIKIKCSGRLGGAEIARTNEQSYGRAPLQTMRVNVEYGSATAHTLYGLIGIKCWICKN